MSEIGRRHFLYGAASVVAGVMGTGCTPDDLTGSSGPDGVPVIAVDAQRRSFKVSPFMTGVNGAKWYDGAYGMWDPKHNRPAPGIVGKIKKAGVGMIRYPGGTSSNLFNWKGAIGPQADRTRQVEVQEGIPVDSRFGPHDQSFTVWYPPVVPKSQTIRVGDTTWREVADLASAGADDPVYTFDARSGRIRFGDGHHGEVPRTIPSTPTPCRMPSIWHPSGPGSPTSASARPRATA
ncbi:hypothetical protein ACWGLG_10310 [Streptomyces antimycoticus]